MSGNIRRMRWAILPALGIAVLFLYLTLPHSTRSFPYSAGQPENSRPTSAGQKGDAFRPPRHPITTLIEKAESQFNGLLSKETHNLASAAKAYRKARGRHPPPGFNTWYEVAKAHDVVMVEEFWDQIYHDLRPFWAVPANQIRADARANNMVVNIKGGKAEANTGWEWHVVWAQMMSTVSEYLPDMVVPCNEMDESRLLVPWEDIHDLVGREKAGRKLRPAKKTTDVYHNWNKEETEAVQPTEVQWMDSGSISFIRQSCPPDSRLRTVNSIKQNFAKVPDHMVDGFVGNYTKSTEICHQPDLGLYHGAINQPLSAKFSQKLIPLFGGSKFAVNNEILLPAPKPWTDDERFSVEGDAGLEWNFKTNSAIWRGTATGGRHHPSNWHQFHRHRFVYIANGSNLHGPDPVDPVDKILTPDFIEAATQHLTPDTRQNLEAHLRSSNDVSFTDLFCDAPDAVWGQCWYLAHDYSVALGMQMPLQFNYKYLPDIDGNSFSGRYRAFLLSSSLPIKATIYREWHDARLVAWKHFVPMDNRFTDYYGILEYFRGFGNGEEGTKGHDDRAKRMAEEGRDWARKVLRKEDMQIYVYRLLLEYARICDDNRDKLAFVGDLL